MSYIEDSVEERLRERDSRRRQVVNAVRGWLRTERSPRLTIMCLLAVCAAVATGFGWILARRGVEAWGERALWAAIAAWPVFLLLVRWRAAVEFRRFPGLEHTRRLMFWGEADDSLALPRALTSARKLTPEERAVAVNSGVVAGYTAHYDYSGGHRGGGYSGDGNGGGGGGGVPDPYTVLFIGRLTLGTFLVWLLVSYASTLLAEMIVDAELVPAKPRLVYSFPHLDWRMEAIGFTAIHFVGIALAAGAVGFSAPHVFGLR